MTMDEKNKIINILENISTEKDFLKYSSVIYVSPFADKKSILENIIRFGDLDKSVLENELSKLNSLKSVANSRQIDALALNYINEMTALVESNLVACDVEKSYDFILDVYESAYEMPDVYYSINESCMDIGSNQSVYNVMESLAHFPVISPRGIITACENVFENDTLYPDKFDEFKDELVNKMCDTAKYEMDEPDTHDVPIVHGAEKCRKYLKDEYKDNSDICDDIDKLFDDFEDKIEDKLKDFQKSIMGKLKNVCEENSFNCNPFNSIYNLTPLPVGTRTVARTMDDCLNADTDEELVEALNRFGELMATCEMCGESILTEGPDSNVAKVARKVKKATDKVSNSAKTVVKKAHDVNVARKKIVDPMVKFIENTYDATTKKDRDERKKAIMAKGMKGKLLKLVHWIKVTGITAIAGGTCAAAGFSVGTVISAIALVGYILKNADLEDSVRREVIRELEDEIKICEEKIEDSRGDDNKQNKYELIRTKSKLEKELARIKMHRQY